MKIKRRIEIDYGHTLPDYIGFCNQLHGHRGTIICEFEGEVINKGIYRGMVIDFSICKKMMMDIIHGTLDHGFAVWTNDIEIVPFKGLFNALGDSVGISTLDFIKARNKKVLVTDEPPTAEYLAKYFFNKLSDELKMFGPGYIKLTKIEWWETPNNMAVYSIEDDNCKAQA